MKALILLGRYLSISVRAIPIMRPAARPIVQLDEASLGFRQHSGDARPNLGGGRWKAIASEHRGLSNDQKEGGNDDRGSCEYPRKLGQGLFARIGAQDISAFKIRKQICCGVGSAGCNACCHQTCHHFRGCDDVVGELGDIAHCSNRMMSVSPVALQATIARRKASRTAVMHTHKSV